MGKKKIEHKGLKFLSIFLAGILGSSILVYNYWGQLHILNFEFGVGLGEVIGFGSLVSFIVNKFHYKILLIFTVCMLSFLIGIVFVYGYIDLFINHKKRYGPQ